VKELFAFFGLSFTALLPLINPIGSALFFLGIVGTAPAAVYHSLARSIAVRTALFLFVVQVTGARMLKFFGISLPVMQVAGGLALAVTGWQLLNQRAPQTTSTNGSVGNVNTESLESKVFYPLTFPLTVGPGSVVVMVTVSAHASRETVVSAVAAHSGIAIAVLVLSAAVYVCYGSAPAIAARIRGQTVHGILRVIAFLLMCIGVQITWNGVDALLKTLMTS
jgi:multiple antibiotic resistance protein